MFWFAISINAGTALSALAPNKWKPYSATALQTSGAAYLMSILIVCCVFTNSINLASMGQSLARSIRSTGPNLAVGMDAVDGLRSNTRAFNHALNGFPS